MIWLVLQDGVLSAPAVGLTKRPSRLDRGGYQEFQPQPGAPPSPPRPHEMERRMSTMGMLQRIKSTITQRKAPSATPSRQQSHDSVESEVNRAPPARVRGSPIWPVQQQPHALSAKALKPADTLP